MLFVQEILMQIGTVKQESQVEATYANPFLWIAKYARNTPGLKEISTNIRKIQQIVFTTLKD